MAKCLDLIAYGRQSLPGEFYEVIVSDDGSKTTACELVERTYPWVNWIEGPHRGPAANRNYGARQAKGEWLVFLDDDCLPVPGWLAALYKAAAANRCLSVLEGKTDRSDKSDHPLKYGIENLYGGLFFSCNLAVKREVFFQLGGFDEDFFEAGGEDMEFAWRIHKNKVPYSFIEEALVLHPVRMITWHNLLWRTAMSRWLLLYRYKTEMAVPLNKSDIQALWAVTCEFSINLMRTTWQFFHRGPHRYFRGRLFEVIWNLISFPFLLPYLLYWELKFRNQLRTEKRAT